MTSFAPKNAPAAVFDAFCATRLGSGGRSFGAWPRGTPTVGTILARQRDG